MWAIDRLRAGGAAGADAGSGSSSSTAHDDATLLAGPPYGGVAPLKPRRAQTYNLAAVDPAEASSSPLLSSSSLLPPPSSSSSSSSTSATSRHPHPHVIVNPKRGPPQRSQTFDQTGGSRTGYSYHISGGPAPSRPPRDWAPEQKKSKLSNNRNNNRNNNRSNSNEQVALSQQAVKPPARNPNRESSSNSNNHRALLPSYRDSQYRPASSVYSQPSPILTNFTAAVAPARTFSEAEDISPPSSPEINTPRDGIPPPSPDISPIDEEPDISLFDLKGSQQQQLQAQPQYQRPPSREQARSNIPMMRRERRHTQDGQSNRLRETSSRERMRDRQLQEPHAPQLQYPPPQPHQSETRWDQYSGEPTMHSAGRSPQVRPGQYAHGLGISHEPGPRQGKISTPTFGDRVRQIRRGLGGGGGGGGGAGGGGGLKSAPVDLNTRPEWRGASGRTALVSPVRDNPDVAPLNIPAKSNKRGARQSVLVSPPVSPPGPETAPARQPCESTTRPVGPTQSQNHPRLPYQHDGNLQSPLSPPAVQHPAVYPSPPLSGSPGPHSSGPQQTSAPFGIPPALHGALDNDKAVRRKPTPSHTHDLSVSSSIYSQASHLTLVANQADSQQLDAPSAGTGASSAALTGQPNAESPWVQPPSRFSVSTYATSALSTPPLDNPDRFGTPPPVPAVPPPQETSILDRKRPKIGGTGAERDQSASQPPIVISMKTPYTSTTLEPKSANVSKVAESPYPMRRLGSDVDDRPPSAMSGMSVNKSLPAAPPESAAESINDRVALLNAQLKGLGNRRININKCIVQMTELMPTDNLLASEEVIRKREAEKHKVEVLRQELAEVQREEYELGLKLHRAYKRMDRESEYEPTGLWVRRVTN